MLYNIDDKLYRVQRKVESDTCSECELVGYLAVTYNEELQRLQTRCRNCLDYIIPEEDALKYEVVEVAKIYKITTEITEYEITTKYQVLLNGCSKISREEDLFKTLNEAQEECDKRNMDKTA